MKHTPRLAILAILTISSCGIPQEDLASIEDFQARAASYYENDDLQRAEQQCMMGLAIDPDHGTLNLILGRTLLKKRDLRSVATSRHYLERAYDANPEFRTSYSLGEFHLRYAEFLIGSSENLKENAASLSDEEADARQENLDRADHQRTQADIHLGDAHRLLTESREENPRNIYALRLAANCATHSGRESDALTHIDQLLVELGESRQWKNQLLSTDGSLNVAEEAYYRKLVREELDMEIQGRALAATIHKKHRAYEESIHMLTEILKLDPHLAREYFNRGMCYYWNGDLASSVKDLKEFVRRTTLDLQAEEVSRALEVIAEFEAISSGGSAASSGS